MALNTNIKVKLPESGWVLSKPNKAGKRYVKYYISSSRVSSNNVNVKRSIIGIYDEESKMLIPNNNYYSIFGERYSTSFIPSSIKNYGNYYLLYKISSDIGLLNILKEVFPSSWDKILTIAMYNICEGDAMYYIDDYCDENFIINNNYISSPETSIIFSKITEEKRQEFFKEWIKVKNDNACIAYDITSISSYFQEITLLDHEFTKDNEINLGIFYGMNSKLPLLYDIYNDSTINKVHFESMLKYASSYNLNNVSLVMDRGFFNKDNISYLYQKNIPFIMGVSSSIKEVNDLFNNYKDKVKEPKYTIDDYENDLISGSNIDINIDKQLFKLHVYYNYYKVSDKVLAIQNKIQKMENEKLVSYEKDLDKINNARNNVEYFALLSNKMNNTTEEILHLYRKKELIEKSFDNIKNNIDCNRLRVHYNETMRGKIFVIFISLILKSVIDTKIKNSTVKKIINELKKIKIQELTNGEEYIAPLTKKQKDILALFDTNETELKESIRSLPL